MTSEIWDVKHLPRAEGRTFLVTGGNAGIGYFVAEQLATTGATVLLGCRDSGKAEAAMASIRERVPGALVEHVLLDLGDHGSLGPAVQGLKSLDAAVYNAGVLLDRRETRDGNELMFATNHLGHFALTGRLAPLLAPGGRIVTTGSFTAKSETLDLDDLQSARDFRPKRAYARSKLAQMLFGFELDRRLRAAGSSARSIVTHPGGALDSLTPARPHLRHSVRLRSQPARLLLQGKEAAAWTAVRAVLDPGIQGGELWGPRVFGMRGLPAREPVRGIMADTEAAARLWSASAELTGVDPQDYQEVTLPPKGGETPAQAANTLPTTHL